MRCGYAGTRTGRKLTAEAVCERRIRNFLANVRKELRRAVSGVSAGHETASRKPQRTAKNFSATSKPRNRTNNHPSYLLKLALHRCRSPNILQKSIRHCRTTKRPRALARGSAEPNRARPISDLIGCSAGSWQQQLYHI